MTNYLIYTCNFSSLHLSELKMENFKSISNITISLKVSTNLKTLYIEKKYYTISLKVLTNLKTFVSAKSNLDSDKG